MRPLILLTIFANVRSAKSLRHVLSLSKIVSSTKALLIFFSTQQTHSPADRGVLAGT